MKTLLQIRSSIFSDGGQSSRLAERFVARWRASNPGGRVIVRDLAKEPVPHLDAARFGDFGSANANPRTAGTERIASANRLSLEGSFDSASRIGCGRSASFSARFGGEVRSGSPNRMSMPSTRGRPAAMRPTSCATRVRGQGHWPYLAMLS